MVAYVSGAIKPVPRNGDKRGCNSTMNSLRRISRDDVQRLSRGQPAKKKGYGSRSVPHRLNDLESEEMQRAQNKGYLTLAGKGNRRNRKGSPLMNIHRQWSDARGKPQIILYKAMVYDNHNQPPLDMVVVDLSPLRLVGCISDRTELEKKLEQYREQINTAAMNAGMVLLMQNDIDEINVDDEEQEKETEGEGTFGEDNFLVQEDISGDIKQQEAWASKPIWQLPVIDVIGRPFGGQRPQAKAMAKELAQLWGTVEPEKDFSHNNDGLNNQRPSGVRKGGKTKMKGLSQHRKRGGGHRQSWY